MIAVIILYDFLLNLCLLFDIDSSLNLVLDMQIDVIKHSFGVHIHPFHQIAFKDELACLPNKEFSYCHKLIPTENLSTMLD